MNAREQIERQSEFLRAEGNLEYRRRYEGLKALRRRRDWLAQRIASEPNDTAINFFRAEKNALDWALEQLETKA